MKENPRIEKDIRCPKCGNNKAWYGRGNSNPQYTSKCSKCGNTNYDHFKGA